jgi:glycosyltransferase involved in cell wall biosynthesis
MKVLFQSRTNLFQAPGGDCVQMLKTKEYLEKIGVSVDISLEFEPDLSSYDLVHLFNLMEPQDIYFQMLHAKKHHKPVVLSTIYGLYTEFERKARGGLFQKVARFLSPYQIEYIKRMVKHYHEKRFHPGAKKLASMGFYRMMHQIVSETAVFLPNSDSEMQRVAKEFKISHPKYVAIPNAIDAQLFQNQKENNNNPYLKYQNCILCAARLEGRKSTLQLVRAVKDTHYTLVLVGKPSDNQREYVQQIYREAGDNVVFLGAIPHEDLRNLYEVAKVHVLASWMETPGLSSLEAAAMECNIVVTKKGDTYDYFEDFAYYCEPDDVDSIRRAIDEAFQAPFNPKLKQRILDLYTWEKTAIATQKAYQMALNL